MTREAALLGVPTYTVFAGRRSAVDETLVAQGLLRRLSRPDELERLSPRTGTPVALSVLRSRSHRIIETFVDVTLEAALRPQRRPSRLERAH
jgi:predicted glycosyltransferase